ncbi:MAG: hypothetical protein R3F27_11485 [Gammaproteobacteria bacterium]
MATRKKRRAVATAGGTFRIVCKNGKWKVYGKDGKEGEDITDNVPALGPPTVIIVQDVVGPRSVELPAHKGRARAVHPPYNTHCHKTIYIEGVPYLVHC